MSKTLGGFGPKAGRWLWIGFIVTTIGTILATAMIIFGGSVSHVPFYAPLQASGWFYIGLALVIVGMLIVVLLSLVITLCGENAIKDS